MVSYIINKLWVAWCVLANLSQRGLVISIIVGVALSYFCKSYFKERVSDYGSGN